MLTAYFIGAAEGLLIGIAIGVLIATNKDFMDGWKDGEKEYGKKKK